LPTVLKELAANVERMFSISCVFTLKGDVPALPQNTTVQLYKICQEAVSNSIKHGKASRVSICLAVAPHELNLTIKNDGVPFSRPASNSRMGLRIMNYRANTIGATLSIEPLKKSGTIVTCKLPLSAGVSSRGRNSRRAIKIPSERNERATPAEPALS
jgi:signal transduction histidine kinase